MQISAIPHCVWQLACGRWPYLATQFQRVQRVLMICIAQSCCDQRISQHMQQSIPRQRISPEKKNVAAANCTHLQAAKS
jgi:hypothetical protein